VQVALVPRRSMHSKLIRDVNRHSLFLSIPGTGYLAMLFPVWCQCTRTSTEPVSGIAAPTDVMIRLNVALQRQNLLPLSTRDPVVSFLCIFQMLVDFTKNYNHCVRYKFFLPTTMLKYKLWGRYKYKIGMSTGYENASWISWISASATKSFEHGERDCDMVWLQEDSWSIRCEHFSLVTFCHVLYQKYW